VRERVGWVDENTGDGNNVDLNGNNLLSFTPSVGVLLCDLDLYLYNLVPAEKKHEHEQELRLPSRSLVQNFTISPLTK
jgi:hypothetical protein